MTINARLKAFRKSLSLNQAELGKRIGLGQGAISKMEQEGSTIIPQNIRLLCDSFNLNEVWLRTGKGEMFNKKEPTDIMERLQQETTLDDQDIDIIKAFVALTPEQRKKGIEFMEALSDNIADLLALENQDTKKDESTDPSEPLAEMPTFCQPFANSRQVTHGVGEGCLSKLTDGVTDDTNRLSKLTAQPDEPADDGTHTVTVSDDEWEVVQMMRKEKSPISGSLSCTTPKRA